MRVKLFSNLSTIGQLIVRRKTRLPIVVGHNYYVECWKPDGTLRWKDTARNTVVLEGLDDFLEKYYRSSGYTAQHYCFLTNATPVFAPSDTMATHPGWTELTQYSEANRPLLQMGAAASQVMNNASNRATYSLNAASLTIGGGGVTDNATKGGTSGLLVGGAALDGGNKPAGNGDTFLFTVEATIAAAP